MITTQPERATLEIARQTSNGITGEFLCFAGLSFSVFENCVHTGGTDFDLCSDNRLAGTGKKKKKTEEKEKEKNNNTLSFPPPAQYKCRIVGETIRF